MSTGTWEPPDVETDVAEGPVDTAAQGEEMDWDGIQLEPEMIEEGNQLGEVISVDDDYDNGGVPLDVPAPDESVLPQVEDLDDEGVTA